MSPAAISVDGLCVRRGGRDVLQGITLDVPAGSVTGLLGPSGCGKSTLMRSIVGVQRVRGGRVEVLGRPAGSPRLRRSVAYTTQAPSIYADLTVEQNLRYFARLLRAPVGRVAAAIEAVSLESHHHRLVGNLSGGQQARVSLATALLADPEVLVLDEPTVGLDPLLREDLWSRFRALAQRGAALLVSSHVMDEAAHCDRLALMRDGRLVAALSPAELRERTGEQDLGAAFVALIRAGERHAA